jgi:hypothetical protein
VAIRALEGLWLVEDYAGLDALSAELFADRAFLATRPRLRELVRNLRLQFVRMILHPPGEPLEG